MTRAKSITQRVKKLLVGAAFCAAAATAFPAHALNKEQLTDSLRGELAKVSTPADSIVILYHILDLSDYSKRLDTIKSIYHTATNAKNTSVRLDMLRYWANVGSTMLNDTIARDALRELDGIPDSEDKRQTEIFLRASLINSHKFENEAERNVFLSESISRFSDDTKDMTPYTQAVHLFALVEAFSGGMNGQLLADYLEKLDELLDQLPKLRNNFLRSKFNNVAAIGYLNSDEPAKSLAADRNQLKNFDHMAAEYKKRGRTYKNYDVQRYIVIRRMMSNYQALSALEVDQLHRQVLDLCENNAEIKAQYWKDPTVRIAALLKAGKYQEALPLVQQQADEANGVVRQRRCFRRLIDVAEKAGATEIMRDAKVRYADLLENYINHKSAARTRELQILYDVSALRKANADAEIERARSRTMLLIIIGAIMAVGLLVLYFLYRRYRNASRQLAMSNRNLKSRQDELLQAQQDLIAARDQAKKAERDKSDLITYISHEIVLPLNAIVEYAQIMIDYASEDSKQHIGRIAEIIDTNAHILQSIANDVQNFSLLDAHKLTIHRVPADVNSLAQLSLDSIRPQVKEGVILKFDPVINAPTKITTDPYRVGTILMALLSNAAKFTEHGSITMAVSVDHEAGTASFTVTDTGIGIPADKVEQIFLPFERLNPEVQGSGLGLPNAVMIAKAMNASLIYDSEYPGPGSRFILIIPIQ